MLQNIVECLSYMLCSLIQTVEIFTIKIIKLAPKNYEGKDDSESLEDWGRTMKQTVIFLTKITAFLWTCEY